jgi:hypothetical protein
MNDHKPSSQRNLKSIANLISKSTYHLRLSSQHQLSLLHNISRDLRVSHISNLNPNLNDINLQRSLIKYCIFVKF